MNAETHSGQIALPQKPPVAGPDELMALWRDA
jgi:hypothetical protein